MDTTRHITIGDNTFINARAIVEGVSKAYQDVQTDPNLRIKLMLKTAGKDGKIPIGTIDKNSFPAQLSPMALKAYLTATNVPSEWVEAILDSLKEGRTSCLGEILANVRQHPGGTAGVAGMLMGLTHEGIVDAMKKTSKVAPGLLAISPSEDFANRALNVAVVVSAAAVMAAEVGHSTNITRDDSEADDVIVCITPHDVEDTRRVGYLALYALLCISELHGIQATDVADRANDEPLLALGEALLTEEGAGAWMILKTTAIQTCAKFGGMRPQ